MYDEPLRRYTSFKIGGPARGLVLPADLDDLRKILHFVREYKVEVFLLGAGSNLLVRDGGFDGLIINLCLGFKNISHQDNLLRVQAGVLVPKLLSYAQANGLGGLEFLVGIPGTIGGALAMNAGVKDHEIGQFVKWVSVMRFNGEYECLNKEQIIFGYRVSSLSAEGIVIEAELELNPAKSQEIEFKMNEYIAKRRNTQPLWASAGSIFKNPAGDYAGRLIEEVGLKGRRSGDAQLSEEHANFIVNLGSASAHDVEELMQNVQREVLVKKGIWLEPEVRIIGHKKEA
ncbi:MAG: UDP-N-acetylmuramate dehydrogenase [Candidatus Schekmanbacteria bacterium]|nr:UDP-N-acetylmuramate dehydrogenase [Candidatus Schekmanbacteria bacterium]